MEIPEPPQVTAGVGGAMRPRHGHRAAGREAPSEAHTHEQNDETDDAVDRGPARSRKGEANADQRGSTPAALAALEALALRRSGVGGLHLSPVLPRLMDGDGHRRQGDEQDR